MGYPKSEAEFYLFPNPYSYPRDKKLREHFYYAVKIF
jgi:hypothetical protein